MVVRRSHPEDARLERWGAWRVGAGQSGAPKVATWATMRLPASSAPDDHAPRLYLEERETHEFLTLLAERKDTADLAAFAWRAYPTQARLAQHLGMDKQAIAAKRNQLLRMLSRMRHQRREGEPLDPRRSRRTGRVVEVMAHVPGYRKPRVIASAVNEQVSN